MGGVLAHAGASYECDAPEALRSIAEQERSGAVRAAERLRQSGVPCPVVSVGSTPTAFAATDLTGVTEVRAGTYVFFDTVMLELGVCTADGSSPGVYTTKRNGTPWRSAMLDASSVEPPPNTKSARTVAPGSVAAAASRLRSAYRRISRTSPSPLPCRAPAASVA